MRLRGCIVLLLVACAPLAARAGFTDTLPQGAFLLDESIAFSVLNSRWDDDGNRAAIIDPVERYEPGGGLQGVLVPEADVNFLLLINLLQYGVLDNLTLAVGIPVVLQTKIDLDLQWEPGDFQPYIGRQFTEQDFWDWAGSVGQDRPQDWKGNKGVLSDIILGVRWRFSDHIEGFEQKTHMRLALMVMGALPTGKQMPPEEIAATGTTMWDLHSQGELSFHISMDQRFPGPLEDRLVLGIDLFYDILFKHEYDTPTGIKNPLMLTYAPYVGETYTLDPGDFTGVAVDLSLVLLKGPALPSFISGHDVDKAEKLPGLLSVSLRYTFTHVQQSDWQSKSAVWDWEREKLWLPGYKNTLFGRLSISLLRLGAPLMLYIGYRNQSWIGGRNTRAADAIFAGIQVPAKFW